MFDPTGRGLASSFSRNGIRPRSTPRRGCFDYVDILDLVAMLEHEVCPPGARCQLGDNVALFIQLYVPCAMVHLSCFQARKILPVGFDWPPASSIQIAIGAFSISERRRSRRLVRGVAGIEHLDFRPMTVPLITLAEGLSMKPYSLIWAKHEI